jgi:hypothetical protein
VQSPKFKPQACKEKLLLTVLEVGKSRIGMLVETMVIDYFFIDDNFLLYPHMVEETGVSLGLFY